jgi:hypothetical protein
MSGRLDLLTPWARQAIGREERLDRPDEFTNREGMPEFNGAVR